MSFSLIWHLCLFSFEFHSLALSRTCIKRLSCCCTLSPPIRRSSTTTSMPSISSNTSNISFWKISCDDNNLNGRLLNLYLPNEAILKKPLHQATLRLQRMIMTTLKYSINPIYCPGKKLVIADYLECTYLRNSMTVAEEFEE